MNINHNQATHIAKIVCGSCLSGKTPYKCIFPTDEKIEKTYFHMLKLIGIKKSPFESKLKCLMRCYLYTEQIFTVVAENIELICRFQDGSTRYWDGRGASKRYGIETTAQIIELSGAGEYPVTLLEYQVDITGIWAEISPFLENNYE